MERLRKTVPNLLDIDHKNPKHKNPKTHVAFSDLCEKCLNKMEWSFGVLLIFVENDRACSARCTPSRKIGLPVSPTTRHFQLTMLCHPFAPIIVLMRFSQAHSEL